MEPETKEIISAPQPKKQDYLRVALVWARSSGLALTQAIIEIKQLA
jgi:hypothetical protein